MLQRIMLYLDTLLDTRMGTLAIQYPEIAQEIIGSDELLDKYRNRLSDELHLVHEGIDDQQFAEAYSKRNVETLKASGPTGLVFTLPQMIWDLERQLITRSPKVTGIDVAINVWPYGSQLSKEEREMLAIAIMARGGLESTVSIVDIPHGQLTASRIKDEDFAAVVVYSFNDWIVDSFKNFKPGIKPICAPGVTAMVPQILKTVVDADKPEKRLSETGKPLDPFQSVVWNLAEYIGIQIIPCSQFCLVDLKEVTGG